MADIDAKYYSGELVNERPARTGQKVGQAKKQKVRSKVDARSTFKLISIGTIFLLMAASILYLLGHADISKKSMEIDNLENYKTELEKSRVDLTADLEGIKSSTKISEDALYKLGMTYPEKDQIIYVSVADEIKTLEETRLAENPAGNLNRFFSFFSSLF